MTATVTDDGNLPILLWLNGGPGCSSLQGALNENGPFVFEAGTSNVFVNEYAWTKFVCEFPLTLVPHDIPGITSQSGILIWR